MNEADKVPADPRVFLAAERTFLAWIRTGIALMGFGFVVARFGLFLHEIALDNQMKVSPHESGFSLPVGIALIMGGITVTLVAAIRHRMSMRALLRGDAYQPHSIGSGFLLAGFLALIGLAVAVYLAFLL